MAEMRLIVDQLKFSYEGPFDMPGLYRLIESFFYEKGFDKHEKLNQEMVLPTGREVRIEMIPYKNITDYFKLRVRIRIHANHLRKIEVEKEGAKIPIQEGKLMIIFEGFVESDRHGRWENTPFQWFLRTLFDKYIFKSHYLKAEQWLVSD